MKPDFKPFDREAAFLTAPYFATQTDRFCDWTVGVSYLWRAPYRCHYAILADCLVLQVTYGTRIYYTCPMGNGDREEALRLLAEHCHRHRHPLRLSPVSPTDTQALRRRFGAVAVHSHRDYYDYLYRYEDLATFAGRHYSGQRNHINQFIKRCPSWEYRPITRQDVSAVKAFLQAHNRRRAAAGVLSPSEEVEQTGCLELLDALHDLQDAGIRMTGGMLTVEGEIVAFSIGEQMGDTLYVHVEKGDIRYNGVYQLMVREYAAHNGGEGILYINREDDAGDEGLRRSKLAYRPCALLEKNTVIIGSDKHGDHTA